jgi:hypothetical protein
MSYLLAQVNIGRLRAPLDSPQLAAFVTALDPVNAAAEAMPGFIWRLQTEEGNATSVRAFQWDVASSAGVIINMSVWDCVESLADFVYSAEHRPLLQRRREFFEHMTEAYTAMWWIPAETRPTPGDAEERIRHLRQHGPTPYAFTFRVHFPPPDEGTSAEPGRAEWMCPA